MDLKFLSDQQIQDEMNRRVAAKAEADRLDRQTRNEIFISQKQALLPFLQHSRSSCMRSCPCLQATRH